MGHLVFQVIWCFGSFGVWGHYLSPHDSCWVTWLVTLKLLILKIIRSHGHLVFWVIFTFVVSGLLITSKFPTFFILSPFETCQVIWFFRSLGHFKVVDFWERKKKSNGHLVFWVISPILQIWCFRAFGNYESFQQSVNCHH